MAGRRRVKCPFDTPEHRKARGPNGRRLCRWCGTEVPKDRRTWCGDLCVREYLALTIPRMGRQYLRDRDGDRCARCGEDVTLSEKMIKSLWRMLTRELRGNSEAEAFWLVFVDEFRAAGFDLPVSRWDSWQSWLEVDHVVPLIEGGDNRVSNLRLLCQACHKIETAALASRRAQRRRDASTST